MSLPRDVDMQNGASSPQDDSNKQLPDITTAKFKVSQVKRQDAQKKAFTRWVNSKIQNENGSNFIKDLFLDLRDGNSLVTLLETLTGKHLNRVSGKLRLHKLNNVQIALDLLKEYKIKLVNIGNTDIVDGVPVPTLGLIWSIIYRFQIQGALADIFKTSKGPGSPLDEKDAEKAILDWCTEAVKDYEEVDIKNFSTSWKDGLAFNALMHRYKPNLFIYKSLLSKSPLDNLEHAFTLAEKSFGVHKLLEPADFQREMIDSRLVVLYVSTLYEKLKELDPIKDDTVTLEEVNELKSYIKLEMDFLSDCDEFFANAMSVDECSNNQELIEQYQNLMTFIDELQPHQEKVGELVNQIETLIFSNLVAEEEAEPLQTSLESLKDLWQKVFDATSARQESLRDSLLEIIKEPIIAADQELTTCKEKLADFADEPEEIHPAWDQYKNFQEYVDELRQLENRIEAIRTGEEAGDALEVLSDEDEEIVSKCIQEMIERFVDLGENVAEIKIRITENLYHLLVTRIEEMERTLHAAERVTDNDLNNNPTGENLSKKLSAYKDLLSMLQEMKPRIEDTSSICASIDENNDADVAGQLRRRLASLNEGCEEQKDFLQKLSSE